MGIERRQHTLSLFVNRLEDIAFATVACVKPLRFSTNTLSTPDETSSLLKLLL